MTPMCDLPISVEDNKNNETARKGLIIVCDKFIFCF